MTENDNSDVNFVEQWWSRLRPLLPAPAYVPSGEVVAVANSSEPLPVPDTLPDGAGDHLPDRSESQAQWEDEELRAWSQGTGPTGKRPCEGVG